jgi:hypothetical protein
VGKSKKVSEFSYAPLQGRQAVEQFGHPLLPAGDRRKLMEARGERGEGRKRR